MLRHISASIVWVALGLSCLLIGPSDVAGQSGEDLPLPQNPSPPPAPEDTPPPPSDTEPNANELPDPAAPGAARYSTIPSTELQLYPGQAKTISVDFAVVQSASAKQEICSAQMLSPTGAAPGSPSFPTGSGPALPTRHVLITGLSYGRTQVTIWSGRHYIQPIVIQVEVVNDPRKYERTLEFIKQLYPESQVNALVHPNLSQLIVTGTVKDAAEGKEILALISSTSGAAGQSSPYPSSGSSGPTSPDVIVSRLKDMNGMVISELANPGYASGSSYPGSSSYPSSPYPGSSSYPGSPYPGSSPYPSSSPPPPDPSSSYPPPGSSYPPPGSSSPPPGSSYPPPGSSSPPPGSSSPPPGSPPPP